MLIIMKLGQEAQTRTIPGKLGYLIILYKMCVGQQDTDRERQAFHRSVPLN